MSKVSYTGELDWLSNMKKFPYPVRVGDFTISSSENYYMSQKTDDVALRKQIRDMSPYKSKEFCKTLKLPSDWKKGRRDAAMWDALLIKFSIPFFRVLLLGYSGELCEHNTWGDVYWGVCNGKGENKLGLMQSEIQSMLRRQEIYLNTKLEKKISYPIHNHTEYNKNKYLCFTANSEVTKDGKLVMGSGIAKEVNERYPGIDARLGAKLISSKLVGKEFNILIDEETNIIAFQTKTDWKKPSDVFLIRRSMERLSQLTKHNPDMRVQLPYPGVGNGGLSPELVLNFIFAILEDNPNILLIKNISGYRAITGIGSRRTPTAVGLVMNLVTHKLSSEGYVIRSGDAPSADKFCEYNIPTSNREIYIPWKSFYTGKNRDGVYDPTDLYRDNSELNNKAEVIAREAHPRYDYLKDSVKSLMKRNGHQVLGKDLNTPSEFILAYTRDGAKTLTGKDGNRISTNTGGTGAAMRLAVNRNIPIINLGDVNDLKMMLSYLNIEYKDEELSSSMIKRIETYQKRTKYVMPIDIAISMYLCDRELPSDAIECFSEVFPESSIILHASPTRVIYLSDTTASRYKELLDKLKSL